MTALVPIPAGASDLPALIDRAASMLARVRTAAEVLEARDPQGLTATTAETQHPHFGSKPHGGLI